MAILVFRWSNLACYNCHVMKQDQFRIYRLAASSTTPFAQYECTITALPTTRGIYMEMYHHCSAHPEYLGQCLHNMPTKTAAEILHKAP